MISIIIPIYNQANKINKCLDSILQQSYRNYEVIIVNDGSTDNLSEVLVKYKKEFGNKLELITNQHRHGAPYARNKGFQRSRGEYVLFCDADLILYPNMLQVSLDKLKRFPQASYAYAGHRFGLKKFSSFPFDPELLKKMPYIHTCALIRRDDFPKQGFDENLKRMQDWDLWLTMLAQGHKGVWIGKILFKVRPGGTMSAWLPSRFYKIFPFLPKVKAYKKAINIVKEKHGLPL